MSSPNASRIAFGFDFDWGIVCWKFSRFDFSSARVPLPSYLVPRPSSRLYYVYYFLVVCFFRQRQREGGATGAVEERLQKRRKGT